MTTARRAAWDADMARFLAAEVAHNEAEMTNAEWIDTYGGTEPTHERIDA